MKPKILILGVLSPPNFGHRTLYQSLMSSQFVDEFNVKFLDMHFWEYGTDKKITILKLAKVVKYYLEFLWAVVSFRPKYVLYNISFYEMPWPKDYLFCVTAIILGRRLVIHDHGQYVAELNESLTGWSNNLFRWVLSNAVGSIVLGYKIVPTYKGLMPMHNIFVVEGGL